MPENQPLLVATFAFDLATQLMPGAQLPAKYLCLLLATFAFDLRNAKAKVQRNLCPLRISKGGNRGGKSASNLCPVRNRQQSTFACCWVCNATYARCASASKVPLPAVGYATQRQQGRKKGTLAWALRAQGQQCKQVLPWPNRPSKSKEGNRHRPTTSKGALDGLGLCAQPCSLC
jgi:hypothetical protein